jgi:proteic killer suppression protein
MIRTFRHKGLRRFFQSSDRRGIPPESADRIRRLLDRLEAANVPEDMDLPGYYYHPLKGDRKGTFSDRVTANLRLTFGFDADGAMDVDLEDCH